MKTSGSKAKPAVLEREFIDRYWGKPLTLHGVRSWLRGETLPTAKNYQYWLNGRQCHCSN